MLAFLKDAHQMFNYGFLDDFASIFSAFILVSLVSMFYGYFWYVYKPYSKFPSCRFEHRIPYWILRRIPMNYAAMQTLVEQSKRYQSEGLFAAWLGVPYVVCFGEEIVKKVLNEPTAANKPKKYKMMEYLTKETILTSNGDVFKKHHKMAVPAFNVSALKTYTTTMNRHSEELIKMLSALDGQPTDDVLNILSVCTFGILDETNLGRKERSPAECRRFLKVMNKATEFIVMRLGCPWLYFDFTLQFSPTAREAHALLENLFKDNIKPRLLGIKDSLVARQASPSPDLGLGDKELKTMGESFVEQHLKDPSISIDDVGWQMSTLIGAGFDTVTHTLEFVLFLLGLHPEAQDRVFEEVTSQTEGHVSYDDLHKLTYLECVIKETLRLYPTIPMFARELHKELQCGEYKIPRGTNVGIFPYMLHRNPEIYPDPEKFNPERFLDKNSKIKPWNFIPFAEGVRPCIGKRYAMSQLKIVLSHVIRNFKVTSLDRMEDVHVTWWAVLHFHNKPPRMQLIPRIY